MHQGMAVTCFVEFKQAQSTYMFFLSAKNRAKSQCWSDAKYVDHTPQRLEDHVEEHVSLTVHNKKGQQQLNVQAGVMSPVSANNITITGLSSSQLSQLHMEPALPADEIAEQQVQQNKKMKRMACTCPNCKDGEK
eukprot:g40105.t1